MPEQLVFLERKRRAAAGLGPLFPESAICKGCGGGGQVGCWQCDGTGMNAEDKAEELFQSERGLVVSWGALCRSCAAAAACGMRPEAASNRRRRLRSGRCRCPSTSLMRPPPLPLQVQNNGKLNMRTFFLKGERGGRPPPLLPPLPNRAGSKTVAVRSGSLHPALSLGGCRRAAMPPPSARADCPCWLCRGGGTIACTECNGSGMSGLGDYVTD